MSKYKELVIELMRDFIEEVINAYKKWLAIQKKRYKKVYDYLIKPIEDIDKLRGFVEDTLFDILKEMYKERTGKTRIDKGIFDWINNLSVDDELLLWSKIQSAIFDYMRTQVRIHNMYKNRKIDIGLLNCVDIAEMDEDDSIIECIKDHLIERLKFDEVPFVKEIEIYAITEGIISSMPPVGYKYAEFYLEDLLPFIDVQEQREMIIKILKYNPKLNGPYYIINPKRVYWKGIPRHRFKKIVYDLRKKKFYKVLVKYIPIETIFEKEGRISIKCILHLVDGSEIKLNLLDINLYLNDQHPLKPIPVFKKIKYGIRHYVEEFVRDEKMKKKLLDWMSMLGNREALLVYVYVDQKPIKDVLARAARYASKLLGDDKKKQLYYYGLYYSAMIFPLHRRISRDNADEKDIFIKIREFEKPFGNQRFSIIPKRAAEELFRKAKKLKKKGLLQELKFFKKLQSKEGEDGYEYILEWHRRPLNHRIISDHPFTILVLGFQTYNEYYIIPSRDGQELEIINKHHGKHKRYNARIRLKQSEALRIIHLDPDLSKKPVFTEKYIKDLYIYNI